MTVHPVAAAVVRGVTWPLIRRHVTRRLDGVSGLENVPATGGAVITPNHRSYYDHFVMLTLLRGLRPGQPVWFVTKSEAFHGRVSRLWHESWHSLPVDRQGLSPSTVKAIRDRLLAGDLVCVYPEGTRNTKHELGEFKEGAFRFADIAGCPVVPVAMQGTDVVLPRGSLRTTSGRVRVLVGEPLLATATGRRARTAELRQRARTAVLDQAAQLCEPGFSAAAARRTAAAVDHRVTQSLDEAGRLAPDAVRRFRRVLRLTRHSGSSGVDLRVQQIRLAGLAATNRRGLGRLLTALPLGYRLRSTLRSDPEHAFAHYLLGRWQLVVPGVLGGGPRRACRTFEAAAGLAAPGDTRALTGLAQACQALVDVVGARSALAEVVRSTDPSGRGSARIARAAAALADEDGASALPSTEQEGAA